MRWNPILHWTQLVSYGRGCGTFRGHQGYQDSDCRWLKLHGKVIAALEVPTSVDFESEVGGPRCYRTEATLLAAVEAKVVVRDWTSNCGLENVEAEGGVSSKWPYKDYSRIYC